MLPDSRCHFKYLLLLIKFFFLFCDYFIIIDYILREHENTVMEKIKIGISSCLLGWKVRFDGQHKYDPFIVETLGSFMDFTPVCPEVECGLPIPREAMRLVGDTDSPRLVTIKSGIDHTEKMQTWAKGKLEILDQSNLCGFIFKSRSPSSGMERVKVYHPSGGTPAKKGVGIFARMFIELFPQVPVEEEGRLYDPVLRENFIERIFVYHRWKEMLDKNNSVNGLISFHTQHKLILMAHSPLHYRETGKITASAKKDNLIIVQHNYLKSMMAGLKMTATVKKNFNVLQHILGYFKKDLESAEKSEMLEVMENYKNELIPLIVPVTLLNHYVAKFNQQYLKEQFYLHPHPLELKLRNHA